MASLPKEIQGIPTGENTKIVHLPTQEAKWRKRVVQHVQDSQKVGPSFTAREATPHAAQPIPNSKALKEVGAERVGAEPELPISMADMKHHLETAGTLFSGDEGPLAHARTVSGKKAVLSMRKRASLLEEEEGKAA